ncbi:MAG: hypothetical protein MI867_20585 [Pseudomonadales bacterium]|nr:hypothetical protein [Pseudomonadales bacterium]
MIANRTLRSLSVLSLLVFLTSCVNENYSIVLPVKNSEFIGQLPNEFLIRYQEQPTKILLNGLRVEQHFEFDDGVATASGALLEGYLTQGKNNLSVEPGKFGPRRYFYFDDEGPRIVVRDVTNDKPPVVTGELIDPSGAYDLTINGIPANIDNDGTFSVAVEPALTYEIQTEDEYAQRSTYHYANRAMIVNDIVKLNAEQSAIDDLIPFAQELVEEQDIAALLGTAGANTLFDEAARISLPKVVIIPEVCVPVLGCTPEVAIGPVNVNIISVKGSLTTLTFQELEIDQLDLNSGGGWEGFSLDSTVRNVALGVKIETDVLGLSGIVRDILEAIGLEDELAFLAGEFNANVGAPRLRLASDIGLTAVNGDVNLSVVSINAVGLGSFDSDFTLNFNVPDAIRNFGFGLGGLVIDIIETGISTARDIIVDLFLDKLVPLIVNLILDPLVNELQVRLGATLNNGAFLTTFMGVQNIGVTNNNLLRITLNGRVGAETATGDGGPIDIGLDLGFPDILNLDDHLLPDLLGIPEGLGQAPGLVPTMLGFKYTPVNVPDPEQFRTETSEVGISVSSNLINQALLAFYEGGVLSPAIPINDDRENTGAYLITDPETANERILFRPQVAPELSFRGNLFSVAYLTLDHFEVVFQDLVNGEWQETAVYELNSELAVRLSNDGEEGLQLALLSPEFDLFYEIGNNREGRIKFPTTGLLFSSFEAVIVEQINSLLRIFILPEEIQLTADGVGLGIVPEDIRTIGAGRQHFGISASLNAL